MRAHTLSVSFTLFMLKNIDRFVELSLKVQRHLGRNASEIELIIKGHLLIEDLLFKILVVSTENEQLN